MKQIHILLLFAPFFLFSCDDDPVVIETKLPLTLSFEGIRSTNPIWHN